jgi:hypothetical protein
MNKTKNLEILENENTNSPSAKDRNILNKSVIAPSSPQKGGGL